MGAVNNSTTNLDLKVVKLDLALNELWSYEFDGDDGFDDEARSIVIDNNENAYVTGYTKSALNGKDIYSCKLDAEGNMVWQMIHNGENNDDDYGEGIVIDSEGNVIIAGTSHIGTSLDFQTIKYNQNGEEVWSISYNSIANKDDEVLDITLDGDDNVIVVGQTLLFDTKRTATVKYVEHDVVIIPDEEEAPHSNYFISNNGQLMDTDGNEASSVKYYNENIYPALFLSDDIASLQFHESTSDSTRNQQRIDLIFNRHNLDKSIYNLAEHDSYSNYHSGSLSHQHRDRIKHIKQVISPNVWEDIDVTYSTNSNGLKIYLTCHTGFDESDLGFEVYGGGGVYLNAAGSLIIPNSIENLTLPQAEAYQVDINGDRIDLSWVPTYIITGNLVKLGLGGYNSSLPLIIEIDKGYVESVPPPVEIDNLLWSTFFGGYHDDIIHSSYATDSILWVTGSTKSSVFSLDNYEQTEELYFSKAFVSTFKVNTAEFYWNTYLDGNYIDIGIDIVVNESNDHCFIVGLTSSSDLPFSDGIGMNDQDHNGLEDGFIYELDEEGESDNGFIKSYIGGNNDDKCTSVDISEYMGDSYDPIIYIVGQTKNHNSGFPLQYSEGSYFQGSVSYSEDCFIMKINVATGVNEWSTYFGSGSADIATDVNIGSDGVYICGKTKSNDYQITNLLKENSHFFSQTINS